MAKTATPFSLFGQNSISRTEARFFTKMFAMDSFDDPENELSLTCTVFSQYEQTYLKFLRNSVCENSSLRCRPPLLDNITY